MGAIFPWDAGAKSDAMDAGETTDQEVRPLRVRPPSPSPMLAMADSDDSPEQELPCPVPTTATTSGLVTPTTATPCPVPVAASPRSDSDGSLFEEAMSDTCGVGLDGFLDYIETSVAAECEADYI